MNKIAAAVAGVVSIALGTLETVPAVAGTIEFNYSDGYANGTLSTDPGLFNLAGNVLGLDLPESNDLPSLNLTASDLTGSFSIFDDPAQFLDGDITLDYDLFSNIFGSSLLMDYSAYLPIEPDEESAIALADSLLNVALSGTGTIDAGKSTTNFAFNYIKDTNSIVINGFDTDVVSQCLTLTCTTTAEGDFSVGLELNAIGNLNTSLNLGLPEGILDVVANLPKNETTEIQVASGSFDFGLTTNRGAVDPDGDRIDATVTGGTVSTSMVVDGIEIPIPERSLGDRIVTQATPKPVPEPGFIFGLLGVGAWMGSKVKRQGN